MRIPGTLLIIGGIFLCVSVVWADVGFVTIGFGVFCVLCVLRGSGPLCAMAKNGVW